MSSANKAAGERATTITEQSRAQERIWLAALDDPAVKARGLDAGTVRPALAGARAHVLERLLRVMIHEHLVGDGPIGAPADGRLVVALPKSGRSLVIECLTWFEQGLSQRFGRVHLEEGGRKTLIEGPVELISVLAAEVEDGSDDDFVRFAREIGDCVRNEGLCVAYRSAWNRRIAATISAVKTDGFWPWLAGGGPDVDPSLFLEQWGAVGHPYHPAHKTKLGLRPREVVAWSPEFEGRVRVRLAALVRERVHVETMPGIGSVEERLERDFPEWLGAWRAQLRAGGRDPGGFVPVPVHPWQADNVLPKLFADAIDSGDLTLLDGPELECAPTMSFRTVAPVGRANLPHIKLPVAIRLTSAMRTISPRTFEMGPRVSRLLQDILAEDSAFDDRFVIVPEEVGIHYQGEGGDETGKHLGALIRPNPAQLTAADEIAVPARALSLPSPVAHVPLFAEIARAAGATSPKDLQRAFRAYAETLLGGATRLYLVYGIGFEAHPQNVLAVFDVGGRLRRVMVRDFGGIRIHRPSLWRSGRRLRLHHDRLTVVETWEEVRCKFVNSVLLHHLGGLSAALAGDDIFAASAFWGEVAGAVEGAFDAVQGDVPVELWRTERRAFLDEDWQVKASARMRITGATHDIFVAGPNPLAVARA